MRADLVVEVAASVAALAAASGLWYARASAQEARDARVAAGRAAQLALMSRRSAERERLHHRVERVGELVQEVSFSSQMDADVDGLSPRARTMRRAEPGAHRSRRHPSENSWLVWVPITSRVTGAGRQCSRRDLRGSGRAGGRSNRSKGDDLPGRVQPPGSVASFDQELGRPRAIDEVPFA